MSFTRASPTFLKQRMSLCNYNRLDKMSTIIGYEILGVLGLLFVLYAVAIMTDNELKDRHG